MQRSYCQLLNIYLSFGPILTTYALKISNLEAMRSIMSVLLLCFSTLVLAQSEKPIVVVELFTSEGCSSCPPADKLLSSIVANTNDEVEVIGLSFHVDYWDYIGWKDPYAKRDYTIRQRVYARKFALNTIYTPQMIVNGKHEFVGSSRSEWNGAYANERWTNPSVELEISLVSKTSTSVTFKVKSEQSTNSQINVAIVERNLSQDVKRGENRGRRLSHDNVVRAFDTRSFDGKEHTFTLQLPNGLKEQDSSLIVYSQSADNWQINGAKQLSLMKIN